MINIVFSSSDFYSPYLGVSLYSLLKNNKNIEDLNIYVLDNGISRLNKDKLNLIIKNYGNANLIFIKVPNVEELTDINIKTNISMASFSRLLLSSLLPDIDKVIYCDCDSLILGSLRKIWNLNIDNYYCAAVLDLANPVFKTSVGLSKKDDYVNAGFLLINLQKWREDNIEFKFFNFLEEKNGYVLCFDQGILNAVLNNKILIINPEYNFESIFFELSYPKIEALYNLNNYYSEEVINHAKNNIIFLHFMSLKGRPWFKNSNVPCQKLFIEYSMQTPFKWDVLIEGDVSLRLKLLDFFINHLPLTIYKKMYNIYSKTIFKLFK